MYRKDKKEEFYTIKARKEGYPARSVYKLKEIDEKFKIVKRGDKVLDLGSAPGSWLIYLSEKVGDRGKVVGVDIEDIKIKPRKNITFIKKDILALNDFDIEWLGKNYNVVFSDLSPKTTGIKSVDVGRSLELSEKAFDIAIKTLAPKGNFICKVFEGEASAEFQKKVSAVFAKVKRFRPKAVIKRSKEFYIVAMGFRPEI